jgi:hypothetical protein
MLVAIERVAELRTEQKRSARLSKRSQTNNAANIGLQIQWRQPQWPIMRLIENFVLPETSGANRIVTRRHRQHEHSNRTSDIQTVAASR